MGGTFTAMIPKPRSQHPLFALCERQSRLSDRPQTKVNKGFAGNRNKHENKSRQHVAICGKHSHMQIRLAENQVEPLKTLATKNLRTPTQEAQLAIRKHLDEHSNSLKKGPKISKAKK